MANSILAMLALQVAGGAAASYADKQYGAQYSQTIPGTDVRLTPGAIGALVGAGLLAIGAPLPAKPLLASLIGGALVYEGTKLAEDQLLPRLGGNPPPPQVSTTATPQALSAMGLPYGGYPQYQAVAGRPVSQFEIEQALMGRRHASA